MDQEIQKIVSTFTKFFFLICCLFLNGCVNAIITSANAAYHHNDLQHSASDYIIAIRIKNDIANEPMLTQTAIGVTSFNRIVLLTGQANTDQQCQRAAAIARNSPNVLRVYNAVYLGKSLPASTIAADTWLTTKIKTKIIASNGIDPSKIKVVTENHVVYLLGIVPKDQADIAVNIARNTSGVNRVVKIFYYVIMPKIN